jgi:hypothetical protein
VLRRLSVHLQVSDVLATRKTYVVGATLDIEGS